MSVVELRSAALHALQLAAPEAKVSALRALTNAAVFVDRNAELAPVGAVPGRPPKPKLVAPSKVPQRSLHSAEGRAALLHALAHIEFNAINLALDAIWRFAGLPADYYTDWLLVAREEAEHFQLLAEHLASVGHDYGDFDAHDGLWQMAEKTAGDVLARMALVPRTLEARGLDASPAVRAKFAAVGDATAVAIVDRILEDEIGHVAIGNRWFRQLCHARGLRPLVAGAELAARYGAPQPKGPFNLKARRAAGFDADEIDALGA